MMNFNFLNAVIQSTNGNEFKVLYLICNTLSLNKTNRIRIYREILAEKCNLTEKQISRITNELERKGLIKKDIVSNGITTKNFYSLNLNILKDKNVPLNNIKGDKNVPLTDKENIENESMFNNKQNMDNNVQINPSNLDKNVPLNNKEYKEIILNKKNNINNNILNIIEYINKENELIEEYEKPIERNDNTNFEINHIQENSKIELNQIDNTITKNDFERNEKSFERKDNTNLENNFISTLNEKQYFNTLKELNQQNTFNSVLQENNNNINSNNSMNKETLQKEIELFNGFENELFKCSSFEQVEALREKLFDWFMRITNNNSKVLKTEYLVTIKQFICKIDTKSEKFKAAEQTDNCNTKALNTTKNALNVLGEQIPSNDNFKPTEDKEKANDEQANKTTSNETNTKENQLPIQLNETQKAGNTPRISYTVQCGELQSQGNIKPTERLEMPLNENTEIVTDALNMILTYEERINGVESVESVESLYTNCKNYFKKWSERYLESLNNDEIDFVKCKYKQMVNSKNDRLATLKYKMSVNLSK